MSSIATFLSKIPSSLPSSSKRDPSPFSSTFLFISTKKRPSPSLRQFPLPPPRVTAATSGTWKPSAGSVDRVHQVHSIPSSRLPGLRSAKNKLVVVEYAAAASTLAWWSSATLATTSTSSSSWATSPTRPASSAAEKASTRSPTSASTKELMEKLHEEEGISPNQLVGDVLYYGGKHAGAVQLHRQEDVEALIDHHRRVEALRAVREGLPDGDQALEVDGGRRGVREDERRRERQLHGVLEGYERGGGANLPRDGKICGRYVGSGKGELVGEILRYQGLRIT